MNHRRELMKLTTAWRVTYILKDTINHVDVTGDDVVEAKHEALRYGAIWFGDGNYGISCIKRLGKTWVFRTWEGTRS